MNRIKTLHIFGGGVFVKTAVRKAHENGWKVVLRTSKRFENDIDGFNDKALDVFCGNNINNLMKKGRAPENGDIGISFSAPWILSKDIIDIFKGRIFNLHNQPLPKYRGGGGASWNILMNDRKGGSCIHLLTPKLDAGKIFSKTSFQFPKSCRTPEDFDKFSIKKATKMLDAWLDNFFKTGLPGKAILNRDEDSEYWPRLNTEIHAWINWTWPISDIESFCNAFSHPHSGAKTEINGTDVRIFKIKSFKKKKKFHSFQTGLIFKKSKKNIFIAHGEGYLVLDTDDLYTKSLKPRLGDRFFTSSKKIENSFSTRIQYTPDGKVIKEI